MKRPVYWRAIRLQRGSPWKGDHRSRCRSTRGAERAADGAQRAWRWRRHDGSVGATHEPSNRELLPRSRNCRSPPVQRHRRNHDAGVPKRERSFIDDPACAIPGLPNLSSVGKRRYARCRDGASSKFNNTATGNHLGRAIDMNLRRANGCRDNRRFRLSGSRAGPSPYGPSDTQSPLAPPALAGCGPGEVASATGRSRGGRWRWCNRAPVCACGRLDLWAHADSVLQPLVARMQSIAAR
jgi:hypothetical protein